MSILQDIKQRVRYLDQANEAFKQLQHPLSGFCSVASYDRQTHVLKVHVKNQQFILSLKMQANTLLQQLRQINFFQDIREISFKYFELEIKHTHAPKRRDEAHIDTNSIASEQLAYIKSKLTSPKLN
jgi:hypothetical protein